MQSLTKTREAAASELCRVGGGRASDGEPRWQPAATRAVARKQGMKEVPLGELERLQGGFTLIDLNHGVAILAVKITFMVPVSIRICTSTSLLPISTSEDIGLPISTSEDTGGD